MAGLVAGDGHIDNPDSYGHFRIRIFDKDKDFLEFVRNLITTKLCVLSTIYWEGTCWCLEIYHKQLVNELISLRYNPLHHIDWLKGFVDAEGSIYSWVRKNNKTYYQVCITNTNDKYITLVETSLKLPNIDYRLVERKELDSRTKKFYRKKMVLINRIQSLAKFLEHVGFRYTKKAWKAYSILLSLTH